MGSLLNNIPPVTKNLLFINLAMYILMLVFDRIGGTDLTALLGTHYIGTPFFEPFQIVTHMFMHSNRMFFHILFNMLILVMFGSHLERMWGPKHYFIFYFACGLGAFVLDNIVHGMQIFPLKSALSSAGVNMDALDLFILRSSDMLEPEILEGLKVLVPNMDSFNNAILYFNQSTSTGVGASGALFGLLAAFAILFPNTELFLMFIPVPVKAKYLIGLYVLYEAYQAFNPTPGDFVNHWAHLGGALMGVVIVLIRQRTNKTNFY